MLKKITNWTFGSVFRTIGRLMAYFLIGIIIALFFVKKDYVKADTYYNVWVGDWRDNYDTLTNNPTFNNLYQYKTINSGDYYFTNLYMTNSYNAHGKNVIINGYVNIPLGLETTFQCSEWYDGGNTLHCEKWTTDNGGELSVNLWVINDSNPCVIEWTNNPYNTGDNYKFFQATCHTEVNNINRIIARVRYVPNTEASYSTTYDFGLNRNMKLEVGDNTDVINNQNQNHQESMNYFNSTISGEVNGTGENGTITDEDAESSNCGIICKLKHLIKMLSIDNIKYLVVPTEEQMNDLFEQMQTKITSKLGILGLPVTVYTRLMQIAMQYQEGTNNWCISWNAVQVPNFEDYNIIQAGQYCFSDMLQNEKINTFRNTCHMIIGGLILLSFIQYLFNCLHRILDVPVQDNYEYFTTEDVYGIDTTTGEVQSHQIKSRTTTRRQL